jgi:hypothetical protein
MKSEDPVVKRAIRTKGTLEPRSRKQVASVLDRLVGPPLLSASVRPGDRETDKAQNIAQLADVAHVPQG